MIWISASREIQQRTVCGEIILISHKSPHLSLFLLHCVHFYSLYLEIQFPHSAKKGFSSQIFLVAGCI